MSNKVESDIQNKANQYLEASISEQVIMLDEMSSEEAHQLLNVVCNIVESCENSPALDPKILAEMHLGVFG